MVIFICTCMLVRCLHGIVIMCYSRGGTTSVRLCAPFIRSQCTNLYVSVGVECKKKRRTCKGALHVVELELTFNQ